MIMLKLRKNPFRATRAIFCPYVAANQRAARGSGDLSRLQRAQRHVAWCGAQFAQKGMAGCALDLRGRGSPMASASMLSASRTTSMI